MANINLDTKIQFVKGVGPKTAACLNRLGIESIQDLFYYYPRQYRDFTQISRIADIANSKFEILNSKQIKNSKSEIQNGAVTIKGKVLGIENKRTSRRRITVTEAVVEDGTGSIKIVWFNQPFLAKMLLPGREVILNGKISYNFYSREVVMESPERALRPMIIPIYGETAGLTSKFISKLISSFKHRILNIEDWLPQEWTTNKTNHENSQNSKLLSNSTIQPFNNELLGIQEAILNIHFPENGEMLERARRRIAFDELFLIALRANLSRLEVAKENAPSIKIEGSKLKDFKAGLPFELTNDQERAIDQIISDMGNDTPMSRLLNGDVGSGKTVVAAIAAHAAIERGFCAAIMAPTEILATQHYETFQKLFPQKKIGLMTSSKKEIDSETKIFIGTHALIQKSVNIKNLGLVVVDEQHRFGVEQRSALENMGRVGHMRPHFLSMTATPIPRTLHLALFGDLDISVIREKPKGRKEIKTRFVESQHRSKAYEFIRAHIKAGRQVFVICPLIEDITKEDSGKLFEDERKTVKREYEKLQKIFPEYQVGMMHGRLKFKEKDAIMADFVANKTNILVSTSVVEVGVDVPNATVMMIEDAERFGLAQLHQFRGRVGRAEHQSFCFLFSSGRGEKAIARLKALESTSDGFKLAEIDLEQRGPGAVFGTEQSGLLDLKMANFSDRILIEEATAAAKSIAESDPELQSHALLKEKIFNYIQNKHLE